jgi:hypothetical protein
LSPLRQVFCFKTCWHDFFDNTFSIIHPGYVVPDITAKTEECMKKTVATFIAVVTMVVALHAFRVMRQSSITGILAPAHRAGQIWAISADDTLKAKHEDGSFHFTVKPGAWKLVVKGAASFRDVVVYTTAGEGKTVDLGKIELQ